MTLADLWRIFRQKPKVSTIKSEKLLTLQKSQEEKILELEERKIENELQKLRIQEVKRARINRDLEEIQSRIEDDYQDDDDEGEDEDNDPVAETIKGLIATAITGKMGGNSQKGSMNGPPSETAVQQHENPPKLSDDTIRAMLDEIPKNQIKVAKSLPKSTVYEIVNKKYPMSVQDFERSYQIMIAEY